MSSPLITLDRLRTLAAQNFNLEHITVAVGVRADLEGFPLQATVTDNGSERVRCISIASILTEEDVEKIFMDLANEMFTEHDKIGNDTTD